MSLPITHGQRHYAPPPLYPTLSPAPPSVLLPLTPKCTHAGRSPPPTPATAVPKRLKKALSQTTFPRLLHNSRTRTSWGHRAAETVWTAIWFSKNTRITSLDDLKKPCHLELNFFFTTPPPSEEAWMRHVIMLYKRVSGCSLYYYTISRQTCRHDGG